MIEPVCSVSAQTIWLLQFTRKFCCVHSDGWQLNELVGDRSIPIRYKNRPIRNRLCANVVAIVVCMVLLLHGVAHTSTVWSPTVAHFMYQRQIYTFIPYSADRSWMATGHPTPDTTALHGILCVVSNTRNHQLSCFDSETWHHFQSRTTKFLPTFDSFYLSIAMATNGKCSVVFVFQPFLISTALRNKLCVFCSTNILKLDGQTKFCILQK